MKIQIVVPAVLIILTAAAACAQETIFNVPSGDILDRGKVYGEFDFSYRPVDGAAGYTPRVVVGVGHRVEIGLNLNGIATPGPSQTTPTPTVKWKAYDGGKNGWAFLVGDDVFLPARNRTYDAGTYAYAEFTKRWRTKTRATFGGYYFSPQVAASGHRGGGQFGIEQPLGSRLTLATDWYTGQHALGFVTPGVIVNLSKKLTWYGSYQIGNSGLTSGNHQFLTEAGWNFN